MWRRTKSRPQESTSCERTNWTHCFSRPGKDPLLWKGSKAPRPPPEPTSQPASQGHGQHSRPRSILVACQVKAVLREDAQCSLSHPASPSPDGCLMFDKWRDNNNNILDALFDWFFFFFSAWRLVGLDWQIWVNCSCFRKCIFWCFFVFLIDAYCFPIRRHGFFFINKR